MCYYKYRRIKINSEDDLPLEKVLSMDTEVTIIEILFNANYTGYYPQVVLENFYTN